MHYHIILTQDCNSQCSYCYKNSREEYGKKINKFEFDYNIPLDSNIDIKKLKKFILKDKDATIIFYGGEPLLQIELIQKIMDDIQVPYRMQTNGLLLDKLPIKYRNKITRILVSIDGDRKTTDKNRGKGTYDKVMKNIDLLKRTGYKGELIARMTISNDDHEIYEQIKHLINLGFYSINWQIDCGFYESYYDKERFRSFVDNYNASIKKTLRLWLDKMKEGSVVRLYPFLGIANSLLHNETTLLRCGAGHSGYAITTDGKVSACPIMSCINDFEAGNLDSDPNDLKKFKIKGRCIKCKYLDLCGGRCLYWNYAELWPKEGDDMICETIIFMIDEIKKIMPDIERLIGRGIISKKQFNYEKYFGPEIIP